MRQSIGARFLLCMIFGTALQAKIVFLSDAPVIKLSEKPISFLDRTAQSSKKPFGPVQQPLRDRSLIYKGCQKASQTIADSQRPYPISITQPAQLLADTEMQIAVPTLEAIITQQRSFTTIQCVAAVPKYKGVQDRVNKKWLLQQNITIHEGIKRHNDEAMQKMHAQSAYATTHTDLLSEISTKEPQSLEAQIEWAKKPKTPRTKTVLTPLTRKGMLQKRYSIDYSVYYGRMI